MSTSTLLPQIVLLTVPAPFLILLLLIALYHLTPLLTLLPNIHLVPLLQRLSTLIPRPKRNLPREFFNLPPRPVSPSTQATLDDLQVFSVRGKVVLLLSGHAAVSLICGWAFVAAELQNPKWALAAIASTALPSALAAVVLFSVYRPSWNKWMRGGGITHETVLTRIAPYSFIPVVLATIAAGAAGDVAPKIILAVSSLLVGVITVGSLVGGYHTYIRREGPIRLSTPDAEGNETSQDISDWLTEPSHPSTVPVSSFSYSPTPSFKTPNTRRDRRELHANDESWVSSPTNTPDTLPSWQFSPMTNVASPENVITRQRSHSPIPHGLPKPIHPTPARGPKSSKATTAGDRTMTTFTSPGGSILGGYEPDPAQPIPPRGFTSLTSFPLSPGNFDHISASRTSLAMQSGTSGTIAFIAEHKPAQDPRASTWTFDTYHSAADAPFTPRQNGSTTPADNRRAPPPPPMPVDMPLPPTPTAARSETAVEWGPYAKESREFLIGERDWVEVDLDTDGLDGWSRQGRGVGVVALLGVLATYALAAPLFAQGLASMTQTLYLVSLILPAPMLAFASYLLRYRPSQTSRQRIKKSSIKSNSTHRSLALAAPSDLSLPATISPKLTPDEKRVKEPNARLAQFLNAKPSVSNFGYDRSRPRTVYGVDDARDQLAEDAYRKNMNRRSGDVWLEMGHAVQGGNRLSRTTEMLKRYPALQVLDQPPPTSSALKRLRGGVDSLLPSRISGVENSQIDSIKSDDARVPDSPIAISITSPSKFERKRASAVSEVTHEGETDEGMTTLPSAEIQVATKGRMSSSPIFFCGRPASSAVVRGEDGYELDWMTAGVLPGLLPNIRIGSEVKIGPGPAELAARRASQLVMEVDDIAMAQFRNSPEMTTPRRKGHSRGHSSSVNFGISPDFNGVMASTPHSSSVRSRLRHKKSFSLPTIHPADFEDVRKSFDDCGRYATPRKGEANDMGIDLPPVPVHLSRRDLSRVTERDEANESSLMRETMKDMGDAILAFSSTASTAGGDTTICDMSSRINLADLAPIIIHGDTLNASFSSSLQSEEEHMAEEMEAVMAMDTPTRAEFVISPPPSSYASSLGGRDSRASLRTTRSRMSMDDIPPVPQSRFSSNWTTNGDTTDNATQDQFTDADEALAPAQDVSLEISELGSNHGGQDLRSAVSMPSMAYSHPHPPPIPYSSSIPNFSRPAAVGRMPAHPPVPVQQLHALRTQRSTETMASDYTQYTTTTTGTDDSDSPLRPTEEFRLSRQEADRLQKLKKRQQLLLETYPDIKANTKKDRGKQVKEGKSRSNSGMGYRDEEHDDENKKPMERKQKNGLKPLELVNRVENRLSMPLPPTNKRVSVLADYESSQKNSNGVEGNTKVKQGQEVQKKGGNGKVSKMSTTSTGSGKENAGGKIAKGSKLSTGSAPRVLRA